VKQNRIGSSENNILHACFASFTECNCSPSWSAFNDEVQVDGARLRTTPLAMTRAVS
jgi:hypothetical protein